MKKIPFGFAGIKRKFKKSFPNLIPDPCQTITHALSQIVVPADPITIRITADTYAENI